MTYKKPGRAALLLSVAAALLLCGCAAVTGGKTASDGNIYASDGSVYYYASDGNVYASGGNVYASDGNVYASYGNAIPAPQYATAGNALPTREVRVSTVDELLAAIAPDTTVVLEPGTYNLSEADAAALSGYYYWKPTYRNDGWELILTYLRNLCLKGATGDPADVSILTEARGPNVLTLENCSAVQLTGLSLGHTEGGACDGGVLRLLSSYSVYMEDCDLYGCGSVGIDARDTYGLTAVNTVIHDCSSMGVNLNSCSSVLFDSCEFRNASQGGSVLNVMNGQWTVFEGCLFRENVCQGFLYCDASQELHFTDYEVQDNAFNYYFFSWNVSPAFDDCVFEENTLQTGLYLNVEGYDNAAVALRDGEPWTE